MNITSSRIGFDSKFVHNTYRIEQLGGCFKDPFKIYCILINEFLTNKQKKKLLNLGRKINIYLGVIQVVCLSIFKYICIQQTESLSIVNKANTFQTKSAFLML